MDHSEWNKLRLSTLILHSNTVDENREIPQVTMKDLNLNKITSTSNQTLSPMRTLTKTKNQQTFQAVCTLHRNKTHEKHEKKGTESVMVRRWSETIEVDGVWWIRPCDPTNKQRENKERRSRNRPRVVVQARVTRGQLTRHLGPSFFLAGDWQNNYVVCADN